MKIGVIVQRYGLEVNGGAELLCRLISERLSKLHDVTVFTTKAIEYTTWKNSYKKTEEIINNVKVNRFGVSRKRSRIRFKLINYKVFTYTHKQRDEVRWVEEQGPYVPKLISYLEKHQDDYDLFIFFTYLYYPTVIGCRKFSNKSILVPFAHDEPYLNLKIMSELFTTPKAIFYSTEEEKKLINSKFNNEYVKSEIGGSGIDLPDKIKKYNEYKNYIIYVGRIDKGKKCDELFENFIKFKKEKQSDLKLILIGKNIIDIPKHKDIIYKGFVSEEEKFSLINSAKCLVLPSEYESLSLVVLEAFKLGRPVIVNGKCEVLKAHCKKSNAGLYYKNYYEFSHTLSYLLKNKKISDEMGKNGINYVNNNYTWDKIIERLENLITYVTKENKRGVKNE